MGTELHARSNCIRNRYHVSTYPCSSLPGFCWAVRVGARWRLDPFSHCLPPSFGFGGRGRPFGDGADLGAEHLGGFFLGAWGLQSWGWWVESTLGSGSRFHRVIWILLGYRKAGKKGSCAGGSDVIPSSPFFFFFTVFFADSETCLRDGAAARSLPAIPHGKLQLVPRDDVTQLYV